MAPKTIHQKLCFRIAEESQLLAEEKWIIETLTKIKKHRNCLQIERLHLENLKAQLKCDERKREHQYMESGGTSPRSQVSSTVNTMQTNRAEMLEFEVPRVINDDMCNTEELNLAVTNSVFVNTLNEFEMEEEEEDIDNCVIDMNMLMYGKHCPEQAPTDFDPLG